MKCWVLVLFVALCTGVPAAAIDRQAFTITRYQLEVQVDRTTHVMVVTGKGSGIELSRHDALICTLRAGKIAEVGYYNDQQQALEAVGLEE